MDAACDLRALDEALVRLRRLWSAGRVIGAGVNPVRAAADGSEPVLDSMDMSSILVVEACARRAEAGGEAVIADIAAFTDTQHSTASRLVDRAQRAGLVRRETSAEDSRRVRVVLTDAGTVLRDQAFEARMRWLGRLLADWSSADVAAIGDLLTRFADRVDDVGTPGG